MPPPPKKMEARNSGKKGEEFGQNAGRIRAKIRAKSIGTKIKKRQKKKFVPTVGYPLPHPPPPLFPIHNHFKRVVFSFSKQAPPPPSMCDNNALPNIFDFRARIRNSGKKCGAPPPPPNGNGPVRLCVHACHCVEC